LSVHIPLPLSLSLSLLLFLSFPLLTPSSSLSYGTEELREVFTSSDPNNLSKTIEEGVERLKYRPVVRKTVAFAEGSVPKLIQALLHDRDAHMARKLKELKGKKVVAVVGLGTPHHTPLTLPLPLPLPLFLPPSLPLLSLSPSLSMFLSLILCSQRIWMGSSDVGE
jgi:hypothetical protein